MPMNEVYQEMNQHTAIIFHVMYTRCKPSTSTIFTVPQQLGLTQIVPAKLVFDLVLIVLIVSLCRANYEFYETDCGPSVRTALPFLILYRGNTKDTNYLLKTQNVNTCAPSRLVVSCSFEATLAASAS
ncbi:TPA: hypothetical protein ACH3X1_007494 [Trebouxia sp. C0004]